VQLMIQNFNFQRVTKEKEKEENIGLQSIYIFFISFDSSGDMLRNPEVGLSLTSTFSILLF